MCVQSLMGSFLDCEGSSVAADDSTPPRRPASGFIAPHLLTAFDASGDACRDDAWCWSGEESEPWASGWLCWKVFMPFLLLAQLLASNSDSAREKWQERLESLLISVWNWKPTGIIPFGFRKRFTSWRPCEFSPLEAWKHFSCHSVACRHGVLFTRGVNQGSRSVWSFCKTLYFNKEKQKWQPDQCFSIYLFSKNKRKGSHQKMRSPEKNVLSITVRNKIFLSTLVKERKFPSLCYLLIYLFLKYMKIARQGSYTFKILNF